MNEKDELKPPTSSTTTDDKNVTSKATTDAPNPGPAPDAKVIAAETPKQKKGAKKDEAQKQQPEQKPKKDEAPPKEKENPYLQLVEDYTKLVSETNDAIEEGIKACATKTKEDFAKTPEGQVLGRLYDTGVNRLKELKSNVQDKIDDKLDDAKAAIDESAVVKSAREKVSSMRQGFASAVNKAADKISGTDAPAVTDDKAPKAKAETPELKAKAQDETPKAKQDDSPSPNPGKKVETQSLAEMIMELIKKMLGLDAAKEQQKQTQEQQTTASKLTQSQTGDTSSLTSDDAQFDEEDQMAGDDLEAGNLENDGLLDSPEGTNDLETAFGEMDVDALSKDSTAPPTEEGLGVQEGLEVSKAL